MPAKKATEKKATFLVGKKSHGKESHQLGEKSQIMLSDKFCSFDYYGYLFIISHSAQG